MVLFRILFGVFYGGLHDFYADDPLCLFRQAEGNGACAAVGVYDRSEEHTSELQSQR